MIASVIVDILNSNVDRVFDYTIPENIDVKKGHRVLVPFANRKIEGYVIDIKEQSNIESSRLKAVISLLETLPSINAEMLELMYFMQGKYHILLADALRLFIPSELRGGRVNVKTAEEICINPLLEIESILNGLSKRAVKQIEAINFLSENKTGLASELNKKFGQSAIKKLLENNILLQYNISIDRKPYDSI